MKNRVGTDDGVAGSYVAVEPARLTWPARARWQLFRLLERLSANSSGTIHLPAGSPRPALWVFVSTIGELNAINPFLRQLVKRMPELQLVLLSDRDIYRAAYLAQYPQAEVVEINADNIHATHLAKIRPPRLVVIAEIPCLPADAPCRLPFGYLHEAKRQDASIALVNGWLYGYAPSCRIDSIERQLLGRDYLKMFDVLCVQNQEVRLALIAAGAAAERVHVTGNIKFDALDAKPRPLEQTRSPQLLASLGQGTRPVIVAGCVTDDDERDLVLDAFVLLRQQHPAAILVLAPRHPEQTEVMRNLANALQLRQLRYRIRSVSPDEALAAEDMVLVLDTMGELRDFYAVAAVAHVGRDHNLLEPLAYGKPVTLRPGWNTTYPSYPVYRLLQQSGVLRENDAPEALGEAWHQLVGNAQLRSDYQAQIIQTNAANQGASRSCLGLIDACCANRNDRQAIKDVAR